MEVTRSWSRAAASTLLAFTQGNLLAQGSWTQTPTSGGPAAVSVHAAAYDLLRLRLVLFGGFNGVYNPIAETWEFDGRDWQAVAPATAPPPRAGHAMAYDYVRSKVVMFGGTTSIFGTGPMQDTWEYDGTTWTQATPLHSPSARYDQAMSFDLAAGQVVMFGGRSGLTWPTGDTWLWNGVDWVQAAVTGPSPRHGHAMCHDLIRSRTVLFGGMAIVDQSDTWEWDGTSWNLVSTTGPAGRCAHGMAFDISRAVSVMHGGNHGGNETWEWDGATWLLQNTATCSRWEHALVYDARLQRTTLFGGVVSAPLLVLGDVQTYGTPTPGSYVAQGTSCSGSLGAPLLFEPLATATGPMIGQTSTIQVTPTPWHTFFVFGWSNAWDGSTPLPVDLSAYGMPGCSLQVSRDAVTSVVPVLGVAALPVAVPHDPFLAGVVFYVQAFPVDLSLNGSGLLATNSLVATVGRL
jgi:hypothetical protein